MGERFQRAQTNAYTPAQLPTFDPYTESIETPKGRPMRKITVTESDDKKCPKGFKWEEVAGKPSYLIRWSRNHIHTSWADGNTHESSLTAARKSARSLVQEGAAWAEVFRYAKNGVSLKPIFMCSYEVEVESGSAVK